MANFNLTDVLNVATGINGHNQSDWDVLKSARATTTPWGPEVVKIFYDTLYAHADAAAILGAGNRQLREETLTRWYEALVSGEPGEEFWRATWLVGLIHIRVGVRNAYMMAIATRVEEAFLQHCVEAFDQKQALEVFFAFKRVFSTVVTVIGESYVSGLISGVESVGINEKLLDRMRNVYIAKRIEQERAALKA